MRWWHGYLSERRCKWFAYAPADATATLSSLKPRLHNTAGCQAGCTTRFDNRLNEQWLYTRYSRLSKWLSSGWMFVYTIQPVVKPVRQPVCNRLYSVNKHPTCCQTGFTTGRMFVYTIQPVVKPVDNRLYCANGGLKSRTVSPFWYRLTQVVRKKKPLNRCLCVCLLCHNTDINSTSKETLTNSDAVVVEVWEAEVVRFIQHECLVLLQHFTHLVKQLPAACVVLSTPPTLCQCAARSNIELNPLHSSG